MFQIVDVAQDGAAAPTPAIVQVAGPAPLPRPAVLPRAGPARADPAAAAAARGLTPRTAAHRAALRAELAAADLNDLIPPWEPYNYADLGYFDDLHREPRFNQDDYLLRLLEEEDRLSGTRRVLPTATTSATTNTTTSNHAKTIEALKRQEELDSLIRELKAKSRKADPELEKILFSGKLSDVVLRFPDSNETISAHKLMLAKGSPIFEAMFQTDMVEKIKGEVLIQEVSLHAMRMVLRYLYNAKPLEQKELQSYAIELYKAAHLYQIEGLKQLAEKALIVNAHTTNSAEAEKLVALSDLYNLTELRKRTLSTVKRRLIKRLKKPKLEKHLLEIESFIHRKMTAKKGKGEKKQEPQK